MNFAEIVYSPIFDLTQELLVKIGQKADEVELDLLDNLYDELHEVVEKIRGCRNGNNARVLNELITLLTRDEYKNEITAALGENTDKLLVLTKLGQTIELDSLDFNDQPTLTSANFKLLVDTSAPLPAEAFGFENITVRSDSIAYINFGCSTWSSHISDSGITKGIISVYIDLIATFTDFSPARLIVVRQDARNTAAMATLRMQIVAHGKMVHVPVLTTIAASLVAVPKLSAEQPLNQFNELILILSEYNSHHELLSKYLSLYHVVESFMYKVRLVEMSVESNNRMFSLRDFKRIYNNLHDNEFSSLQDLIKMLWSVRISGATLQQIVMQRLNSCRANLNREDANEYLKKINIFTSNGLGQLSGMNEKLYSKLIYHTRNAIVHNGDTEFHLSHHSLNQSIQILVEEIIMKPLEAVLFTIIGDHTSKVWYRGDSLLLYANT